MPRLLRLPLLVLPVLALLLSTLPAAADHDTRPHTENMIARGHAPNPASFFNPDIAPMEINSDLAFWGDLVFHGNYDGFRIIDASDVDNPREIVHQRCEGNQGDVVVWENILVRSWNSPAPEDATCDGQPVREGWEGLHVFDISNLEDPELIASVETPCGSHTATLVPDVENGRVIVYNQGAGRLCLFMDVVEVPLDDPASARIVWQEPMRHHPDEAEDALGPSGCHDSAAILGDANMLVCASGHSANVFDIGENRWEGGSLDRPSFLYTIEEQDVGVGGSWHSATFTWDGKVIVLGWEPGGGAEAECEEQDPEVRRKVFFYDSRNGEKLGEWQLPRPQTAEENCTIHNFNVIPMRNLYFLVSGNYQAGTWVTNFTNPAKPKAYAWSDPEALVPKDLGGAWSSYWYDGFIYESAITEGLNIFEYRPASRRIRRHINRAVEMDHLNPQTQEFTLP